MKKNIFITCLIFVSLSVSAKSNTHFSKLENVEFDEIKICDKFWFDKIKTVQDSTLPSLFKIAQRQGKLDNFKIVANRKKGKLKLYNAPDSDIYKLIEAAGYSFATNPNASLEAKCDSIIDDIIAAQDNSGYIHTQYMFPITDERAPSTPNKNVKTFGFGPENRWKSYKHNWPFAYSQLYCAGHLMEAGIAYFKGTGKRDLLDAALRFADNICENMTLEKIKIYGDHPQVEIGLTLIYQETGDLKYLNKADEICRYVNFSRPVDLYKEENSKPLDEQSCAWGHCVRTAYIYSGATDVVRGKGASDLKEAMIRIWDDITSAKMYIHGGTGNGTQAEQHGERYDLPISPTYSECCANIAQAQWNYRLNLLTGEKKYADLVEWEMYNSALSGMSQDGLRFSYSNKINIGKENRKNKHSGIRESYLFCCPSKIPGFITGIGRWIYAKSDKNIYINQYIGSSVKTVLENNQIELKQESNYPWSGNITITISDFTNSEFGLMLRIPQWVNDNNPIANSPYYYSDKKHSKIDVRINDSKSTYKIINGYIHVKREWNKGDIITLEMPMEVRRIYTEDVVKSNQGRTALSYGPVMYCMEEIDNDFDMSKFILPAKSNVKASFERDLFNGIIILKGKGKSGNKNVEFKAVPYFLWENRGIGEMQLLPVEEPSLIQKENIKEFKMNTNG